MKEQLEYAESAGAARRSRSPNTGPHLEQRAKQLSKVFSTFAPRSPHMSAEQFLAVGDSYGLLSAPQLSAIYRRHASEAMTFAQFRDAIYDVAVTIRVERFDRRGTEPFEPFEPFEFFQNRNFRVILNYFP